MFPWIFVLFYRMCLYCKEGKQMNELLKALYDNFYEPLPETELKKEIEECHRQLIEVLDKPERRLVLQIIDDKD